MGKEQVKKTRKKKRLWLIPLIAVLVLCLAFFIYTGQYYRVDDTARAALASDETVTVTRTGSGWLFDGPSDTDALIFYPGGKVEETAYAPLLHRLAAQGMDVFLVKMPFRLAVFGADKAARVMAQYEYAHWYIGGHSLGGVMAANFAAAHASELSGVFMLAAYPAKPLADGLRAVTVYGSEDRILNRAKLEEASAYLPDGSETFVIEGGTHAQFGNYGPQAGDGSALITSEEMQRRTVELILANRQAAPVTA